MNTKLQLFIIIVLFGFTLIRCKNISICNCHENLDDVKKVISDKFRADSVIIDFVELREEAYFPTAKGPLVIVINPTTNVLDFKSVSLGNPEGFNNYSSINDSLRIEGQFVVDLLKKHCNLNDCNEIILWFGKGYKNNRLVSRFGLNYKLE